MADQTSYVEQVARQAPFLEDYQRRLLASTQTLTDQPYAQYTGALQAGFSADQLAAFDLARQGVGSYTPFLAESGVYARGAPQTFAAVVPEATNLYRSGTGQFQGAGTQTAGAFAPMATLGGATALGRQATLGAGAGGGTGLQSTVGAGALGGTGRASTLGIGAGGGLGQAATVGAGQLGGIGQFTPMGMNQAALGKAGILGAGAAGGIGAFQTQGFDPTKGTAAYMSPYLQQVKDVAMQDINREANLAAQQQAAQAVKSGAFGGGREGVQRAEMSRNVLDTKAKALAGIQQAGYEQAQQAAMSEFARQQQASQAAYEAQRQAQLSEIGRATGQDLQAYEAQRQAMLGETGRLSQQQQAAYEAQRQAQLAEIGRATGQEQTAYEQAMQRQLAEVGRATGQEQAAYEAQRQAQLAEIGRATGQGMSAYEAQRQAQLAEIGRATGQSQQAYEAQRQALLAETGRLSGQQLSAQESAEQRRLAEFARQQQAAQSAYEAQRAGMLNAAQGIAGLGSTGAGLLQQASSQMAGLGGLAQQYNAADVSMLSQAGALQQQQVQGGLDLAKQQFTEAQMQPYQRMAFMSDILRGVPSTQSTLTASSAPAPSGLAQGIGAMSAIAGMGGSEGFGWWGGD